MDAERKHTIRKIFGCTMALYEAYAFIIDRPDLVPRLTDVGRMHWAIGTGMAAWTTGHLLKPSFTATWIRIRARLGR